MKNVLRILLAVALVIGFISLGNRLMASDVECSLTDWSCMKDCQDQGYSYMLCKKMCSY